MNPLVFVAPVLAALGWWVWQRSRRDQRTRGLCSRARLIDGPDPIPVSITLQRSRIEFFNAQFARTVRLDTVEAVEYMSDLVTGDIADGALMRVKSRGHDFDFVMDTAAATEWSRALPPR